ncbi:putative DD41D transposase [Trichonephila clavipes]|nr:putative DD41D transposase [Trichonephila clavipes]
MIACKDAFIQDPLRKIINGCVCNELMSTEPGKVIGTKLSFQMNHTSICGTMMAAFVLDAMPVNAAFQRVRYRTTKWPNTWSYGLECDFVSWTIQFATNCQVIYSQFGLAIHQNDHQSRRRFVEWAQNEIAVVPDFHKRILFRDEAHFWLNGYVNKQNCRIWSEANPQVYVETPFHPEKLTVWCALWAGGILLQKR